MVAVPAAAIPNYRVFCWWRNDFLLFKGEKFDSSYFSTRTDEDSSGAEPG